MASDSTADDFKLSPAKESSQQHPTFMPSSALCHLWGRLYSVGPSEFEDMVIIKVGPNVRYVPKSLESILKDLVGQGIAIGRNGDDYRAGRCESC